MDLTVRLSVCAHKSPTDIFLVFAWRGMICLVKPTVDESRNRNPRAGRRFVLVSGGLISACARQGLRVSECKSVSLPDSVQ